jgi:sortase A
MTVTAEPPVRRRRRGLRALSGVLMLAGALLLVDAALTLLWQEPLSAAYTQLQQGRLQERLDALDRGGFAPVQRRALARLRDPSRRLAFAARAFAAQASPGDPIGRIRVPSAGVDDVVVEGTGGADLRRGPGHYPSTPLPGRPGTVAIAGHRTTYGAPFRHLDAVRKGDRVEVRMPYGTFAYRVERTRIVPPTATWVTRRVAYDRLILSACHPLYSAAQRIVVFARLESARPRGAAAAGLTGA